MIDSLCKNRTALALGNFDGLHKGHLQVLSAVCSQKENGLQPVLVRFDPHPAAVLRGKTPDRILTDRERSAILSAYQAEETVLDFSSVCDLSPEAFVKDVLVDRLHAGFIACGFNFRFGKNGAGTAETLKELARKYSIGCFVAEEVDFENLPVSATRIRDCIRNGQIEQANAMLTRPFSYDFEVVGGDRRGRLMGTPTINQYFPQGFAVPKSGVYASFAVVDGVCYPAVTNIGIRPTFNGTSERSETWIMHFSGDLYGKHIPVYLLKYLRGEVKFDNMDSLRKQILSDSVQSQAAFENYSRKNEKI
ncbi:MAG: riboflavin biosynthesis protein RibF [Ruminococcaceae bacterium]|nr:riboflavin biosynthesis protein RibF [Oscillospiraceae bacterium]